MANFFATPWTVVCQVSLSTGFPRQEYCSGSPYPPPGDLPNQGLNQHLLPWQEDSLPVSHLGNPWDPKDCYKSRCGWDIKEVGLLCFSVTHVHNAHARMHTHTDLVPHWVASFIYPFECPTNRSDSTCLEITKASFSDCHFLLPLSISSNQKFEISFDLFLLLTSCSINLQLLSILPPKCLCLLFSPHSLYISFGTG